MTRENALLLDVPTTALLLLDLQYRNATYPYAPAPFSEIVSQGARLAEAARSAGALVLYAHVLEPEVPRPLSDMPLPETPYKPEADKLAREAGMQQGDVLITKRQMGAFYATDLDLHLRRRGIRNLVLGGVNTERAIESTARAANDLGYNLIFAVEAMGGLATDTHRFMLEKLFPMIGRVRNVEEIISALRSDS